MKIITLLSVLTLLSFQAKASDFDRLPMPLQASMILSAMPLLTINASVATTTGNFGKEARQVIVDGQDYLQTGEMTPFLAERVKRIQSYEEMSDDEAIDALFNIAESVLN